MATSLKSDLLDCLSGSNVIVEGDERWPDAIKRWTGYQAKIPAAVVRVLNEEDVISAVSYAVKNQRPFVVRGGGHSNGFSTVDSPGIVIDLSGMKNVTVDVEKQVVVAQGGATMGDGVKGAGAVGMAVATGTCNEVGLVGATLGGGIGRFLGHLGYAADTVLSMRVVVVGNSGVARVVEASNEVNSDLLWGLRGSGHLFGVVVEATFRALPWSYDTWHSCLVFVPNNVRMVAEAVDKVHYRGGMQGRLVFCAPNKKPAVLLQLWYVGPPEEAASKFHPLLDLPSLKDHPLNFVGRRIPYLHLNDSSERICGYEGRKNLAAFGMNKMSAESCEVALKVYMDFLAQHPEAAQTHILTEFYSMDVAQELDTDGQRTSVPVELRQEVKYWVMPLAWYEDPALDKACADLNKDIQEAFLIQPDGKRLKRINNVSLDGSSSSHRSPNGSQGLPKGVFEWNIIVATTVQQPSPDVSKKSTRSWSHHEFNAVVLADNPAHVTPDHRSGPESEDIPPAMAMQAHPTDPEQAMISSHVASN
ncbi:hypothetical protein BFJ63_vAg18047 [Fusarium oxysporum f. sp. narcissi]|uniref:FAD-binding PCMH-type domain-containing protein n=2 Tax=Fusarium oxysporum TaxID=5507 RepID=A0A4Q2UX60_FUSOX|nr:hypothetical protein BFJ65_g11073 [Fusarium oxysporum f. sp. cepae]RKK31673.1 hypothetical protein BFJ67_g15128 [Fusarium oxysporum f. sp. cepae]RYC79075.1 hypothetical protein BFJ63_vAg18047 [Fusarium oxysporum f. sp. narcissi]